MLNKYWFKPKKYGIGAVPSSWEGWIFIIIIILIVLYRVTLLDKALRLFVELAIIIIIIITVTKAKTDGIWKWRWG